MASIIVNASEQSLTAPVKRNAKHPPLSGRLNYKSVMNICDSEQVMVYGWGHCKYLQVAGSLEESPHADNPSPFKKVYDCAFGDTNIRTLENRKVQELPIDIPEDDETSYIKELNRRCKSGITNLVLENLKREEEGLPIIPLLFCIDIDDQGDHPWDKRRNTWDAAGPNPWVTTPELLCEKDRMTVTGQMNHFTTHSELRRCYKLANTFNDAQVRAVANRTFRFVKVIQDKDTGEYRLEQIQAPWDHPDWNKYWTKRMEISAQQRSKKPSGPTRLGLDVDEKGAPFLRRFATPVAVEKRHPWRRELTTAVKKYRAKCLKQNDNNDEGKRNSLTALTAKTFVENCEKVTNELMKTVARSP